MTDAINNACTALRRAASRFREQAEHWRAKTPPHPESVATFAKCASADDALAEECEKALAALRMQASDR
jgi:hypothetical protein